MVNAQPFGPHEKLHRMISLIAVARVRVQNLLPNHRRSLDPKQEQRLQHLELVRRRAQIEWKKAVAHHGPHSGSEGVASNGNGMAMAGNGEAERASKEEEEKEEGRVDGVGGVGEASSAAVGEGVGSIRESKEGKEEGGSAGMYSRVSSTAMGPPLPRSSNEEGIGSTVERWKGTGAAATIASLLASLAPSSTPAAANESHGFQSPPPQGHVRKGKASLAGSRKALSPNKRRKVPQDAVLSTDELDVAALLANGLH